MEEQKLSPGKFALSYGIVLGLVIVVISVLMYVTGMQLEGVKWPMYLYYVIFACIIFYAISQRKKSNGNLLKLGEAIKIGLVIGAITGLISTAYTLLFNYVIDPGFMEQMIEINLEKMAENPNMTEEMMNQSQKMLELFQSPLITSALTIAGNTFFGLFYSLIGGLVMKKEDPQY